MNLKDAVTKRYDVKASSELPKPDSPDHPSRDGFSYPGSTRPVPLSNLFIPNQDSNPIYEDVVDYYASKGKNGKPYKMPSQGKPIVVIAKQSDFPKWKKLNAEPLNPDYPTMFVMDGVHRIKAAEKLGKEVIEVKFDMLRNFL